MINLTTKERKQVCLSIFNPSFVLPLTLVSWQRLTTTAAAYSAENLIKAQYTPYFNHLFYRKNLWKFKIKCKNNEFCLRVPLSNKCKTTFCISKCFFLLIELKIGSPAASISIYNLIFSIVVSVFNSPFKAPYNILDSVAQHITLLCINSRKLQSHKMFVSRQ